MLSVLQVLQVDLEHLEGMHWMQHLSDIFQCYPGITTANKQPIKTQKEKKEWKEKERDEVLLNFGFLGASFANDINACDSLACATRARTRMIAFRFQRNAWPARLARLCVSLRRSCVLLRVPCVLVRIMRCCGLLREPCRDFASFVSLLQVPKMSESKNNEI